MGRPALKKRGRPPKAETRGRPKSKTSSTAKKPRAQNTGPRRPRIEDFLTRQPKGIPDPLFNKVVVFSKKTGTCLSLYRPSGPNVTDADLRIGFLNADDGIKPKDTILFGSRAEASNYIESQLRTYRESIGVPPDSDEIPDEEWGSWSLAPARSMLGLRYYLAENGKELQCEIVSKDEGVSPRAAITEHLSAAKAEMTEVGKSLEEVQSMRDQELLHADQEFSSTVKKIEADYRGEIDSATKQFAVSKSKVEGLLKLLEKSV